MRPTLHACSSRRAADRTETPRNRVLIRNCHASDLGSVLIRRRRVSRDATAVRGGHRNLVPGARRVKTPCGGLRGVGRRVIHVRVWRMPTASFGPDRPVRRWSPARGHVAFEFFTRFSSSQICAIPFQNYATRHHETSRSSLRRREPALSVRSRLHCPPHIHSRFVRVPQCLLLSVAVQLAPRDRARDPDRGKTALGRPPASRSSGQLPVPKPGAPVALKRSRTTRQRGTART